MQATHTPDSFDVFNESFKDKFTYWAYHIARPGRGYSRNSVCATFSILKIWLNAAMKEGLLNTDFHKSLPTKEHTEKKIALTEDDITALYNLDIPKLMKESMRRYSTSPRIHSQSKRRKQKRRLLYLFIRMFGHYTQSIMENSRDL